MSSSSYFCNYRRPRRDVHFLSLLILLFPCILPAYSSQPLKKVLFDDSYVQKYGSRCLDGTPSGYYVRLNNNTSHPNYNDWVFFLRGGGLCVEPIDCYIRLKTIEGSSTNWTDYWVDNTGVLSTDAFNPFSTFNHIYVPYCSGDTHTGTMTSNDLFGFYFSGHLTIVAILAHLRETTHLSGAKRILLSGGSAGGIGVFNNADYFRDQFPNAIVKASPQAGYFFPQSIVLYEEWLVGLDVPYPPIASEYLSNFFSSYVNENCAKAHPEGSGRCWDAGFLLPYIKTPILVVNNLFDFSQLQFLGWLNDGSADSKKYLTYYASHVISSVQQGYTKSKDGYFLVGCYDHTGDLCMASPTLVQNLTYADVLSDWFFETNKLNHTLIDWCWNPNGGGPCNVNCPSLCG